MAPLRARGEPTASSCPGGGHLDRRNINGHDRGVTSGAPRRLGGKLLQAFQAFEHGFVWQARVAVIVVGLTGFYMARRLDLWGRFRSAEFWWMHAMVCVWLLLAFVLFVAEPFILHRHFGRWATARPQIAFAWLHRAHWVLLLLSLVTIAGAVAGSQGWSMF